jgi:predicted AAA+ superfamily ATPase
MIERARALRTLASLLNRHRIVGIIGARQVGKTTLARLLLKKVKRPSAYYDLENPEDIARLADPMLALKPLKGIVVIDEIQRLPEMFQILRVLADRPKPPARFLVLGSASPELLQQSSETLAGRIYYYELGGFSIEEVGAANYRRLWLRGGFPMSYLATSGTASEEWRRGFIRTFLERDLSQLGITIRSTTMYRFWNMLAHYHGGVWNASEFGRSFGVADTTVRNYLDLLTYALVVRQLQPWHENISKRQIKSPKVYIRDNGLLHSLLGIKTYIDMERHPKIGASWEGFVIEQIIRTTDLRTEECFFWGTHAGAELDLFVIRGNKRFGFEVKLTTSPSVTPSMRNALSDLKLNRLFVIHAGDDTFALTKEITAVAFRRIMEDIRLK